MVVGVGIMCEHADVHCRSSLVSLQSHLVLRAIKLFRVKTSHLSMLLSHPLGAWGTIAARRGQQPSPRHGAPSHARIFVEWGKALEG